VLVLREPQHERVVGTIKDLQEASFDSRLHFATARLTILGELSALAGK
jgi:hypothetical protein